MIDFHTHVLPRIDDGSQSLDETIEMLREEHRQGVTTVVATPHFYAQKSSIGGFLERRERAFGEVVDRIREQPEAPVVLRAAEVYYFPGISSAAQLPLLTVEGTDVLLLEMPFAQWTDTVYREVREIVVSRKLTVVLVHLERFRQFQKDRCAWEDVLALPVCIQINAGSLLEWRGRRIDKKLLDLGLPTVLGSDCHNMRSRVPNLQQGREVILRTLGGQARLDALDQTARHLLRKNNPAFP